MLPCLSTTAWCSRLPPPSQPSSGSLVTCGTGVASLTLSTLRTGRRSPTRSPLPSCCPSEIPSRIPPLLEVRGASPGSPQESVAAVGLLLPARTRAVTSSAACECITASSRANSVYGPGRPSTPPSNLGLTSGKSGPAQRVPLLIRPMKGRDHQTARASRPPPVKPGCTRSASLLRPYPSYRPTPKWSRPTRTVRPSLRGITLVASTPRYEPS